MRSSKALHERDVITFELENGSLTVKKGKTELMTAACGKGAPRVALRNLGPGMVVDACGHAVAA